MLKLCSVCRSSLLVLQIFVRFKFEATGVRFAVMSAKKLRHAGLATVSASDALRCLCACMSPDVFSLASSYHVYPARLLRLIVAMFTIM